MFVHIIYIYIERERERVCDSTRKGGRAGAGGGGGRGGGGGGGETAQIHWRRRNFTAGPWGSFMGSHRGTPPPPTMALLWGGQWGGD